ncbi:hypothetical protein TRIUR3_24530 [Triticum urartu]|uniref:Uncharacterized protein n=1 Tax=Triticum urartu TaxID=4572 RepID=M8AXY5_TRIUA|nr:hypothetical protein TRIUR3_24530 [Triticum urartu]
MAALRCAARRIVGDQPPRLGCRGAGGGDDDPLTSEEKMRLFKRGAHLIFRMTKAISTVVACGIVIKGSVTEGLRGNPPALEVGPVLGDEMLAAEVAAFKSMVKDMKREAAERLED